ncbi:FAD-dependent oxidoreductase [Amycolatopsis suaedae]|uniref:FAD-dependent monooxygenase n=1 Tax=Amycolatopsis suaedae TaxID=2510978 RepID=A0A4Q7J9K7_9PSEU|nr:NAD(P)/FAD-dependent oxidoreductase [Amycolatopsis suaedae]RZQ63103.1 FAD-dependent monooxygenase [Amycolatopsis suaedae]
MSFHVLIIGAGTGGMALAHSLKKQGVSVAVYERDRTRADFLQGFRVGINPEGTRALKACLPADLFELFVATCAAPMQRANLYTERLSELVSLEMPLDRGTLDSEKSVSRVTLKQVLRTDVDDILHFGKFFSHYSHTGDGRVVAHFEDGTSATGDVLVAADGTRSRVRAQYLPHAELDDAEMVSAAGKVPLDDRVRRLLPPNMLRGMSLIFAPRGRFFISHVMEFPWDGELNLKNGIGDRDADLIAAWPGLRFDNTRDHVIWGVAVPPRLAPAGLSDVEGAEVIEVAKAMSPGWSDTLHRLFDLSDPTTCGVSTRQSTSRPIPQWDTTNVTLIGDAIHTMTPGRGVGANTALKDARLLGDRLGAAHRGEVPVLTAIREYETRMIDYGFTAVRESLKAYGKDNPLNGPVLGRAMLGAMRGGARTLKALPPLRRAVVNRMLRDRGARD